MASPTTNGVNSLDSLWRRFIGYPAGDVGRPRRAGCDPRPCSRRQPGRRPMVRLRPAAVPSPGSRRRRSCGAAHLSAIEGGGDAIPGERCGASGGRNRALVEEACGLLGRGGISLVGRGPRWKVVASRLPGIRSSWSEDAEAGSRPRGEGGCHRSPLSLVTGRRNVALTVRRRQPQP